MIKPIFIGLLFAVLFCFNSCQQVIDSDLVYFPHVKDTLVHEAEYANRTSLTTAEYRVLYIGPEKDTILTNYFYSFAPPPPPPPPLDGQTEEIIQTKHDTFVNPLENYYLDWLVYKDFPRWDSAAIEIKIDTSVKIHKLAFSLSYTSPCIHAYPIFVKNMETDTIYIGYGNFIPLILEAQDSSQNWRPIEERRTYRCGVGVGSIILPPNEMLLTACTIDQGNFQTQLRLKLGQNYSQPFSGNINYSQFEE